MTHHNKSGRKPAPYGEHATPPPTDPLSRARWRVRQWEALLDIPGDGVTRTLKEYKLAVRREYAEQLLAETRRRNGE